MGSKARESAESCGGGVRFWVFDLAGQRAHVMLSADFFHGRRGKRNRGVWRCPTGSFGTNF